jgi:hypothetical protein
VKQEDLPRGDGVCAAYEAMPRYSGDFLDRMLYRPWGWSDPVVQNRYLRDVSVLAEEEAD